MSYLVVPALNKSIELARKRRANNRRNAILGTDLTIISNKFGTLTYFFVTELIEFHMSVKMERRFTVGPNSRQRMLRRRRSILDVRWVVFNDL